MNTNIARIFLHSVIMIASYININASICINGEYINALLPQSNQARIISISKDNSNHSTYAGIKISGDKENIEFNLWNPLEPDKIHSKIQQLLALKSRPSYTSKKLSLSSANTFTLSNQYCIGSEKISFQAGTRLEIVDSILESSHLVHLVIKKFIDFDICLVDAPAVLIQTDSPTSLCAGILVVKDTQKSFPLVIVGFIDFENDDVDIVFVGAEKVSIQFNETAFSN